MKFSLNLIMFVFFLCLFGYTMVIVLRPVFSPLEGAVGVWWLALLVEEIRQLFYTVVYPDETDDSKGNRRRKKPTTMKRAATYFQSYWNIMDVLCLVIFACGAILISVVHVDTSQHVVYDLARFTLTVSLVLFTLRLLQYLVITEFLGSVLEMIWQMMKDLLRFLLVMFIFIVAQGLGAQTLQYPNALLRPQVLLNILRYPFWNIFGELFLDEIEASEVREECTTNKDLYDNDTLNRCPSELGRYAAPILMGFYVVLMNILLLNIIIARFSYTFQKVQEQAVWLAAWHQARITLEYLNKPLVPPPFNIFYLTIRHIYQGFKFIFSKTETGRCKGKVSPEQADSKGNETDVDVLKSERKVSPEQADSKGNETDVDVLKSERKVSPEQADSKGNETDVDVLKSERKVSPEQADSKGNETDVDVLKSERKVSPEQADSKGNETDVDVLKSERKVSPEQADSKGNETDVDVLKSERKVSPEQADSKGNETDVDVLKSERKVSPEQADSKGNETDVDELKSERKVSPEQADSKGNDMLKWERTMAEYYLASTEDVKTNENTPFLRLLEIVEDLRMRQLKLEKSSHISSSTA